MSEEKKIDPKKALKYEQKGDKLFGKKKYHEALDEYQKSEGLNPERPEIYEKLIAAHGQFEHEWKEDDFANSMSWTMRHQELTNPQIKRLHQVFTAEYQEIQKLLQSLMIAGEKAFEDKLAHQILDYGEKAALPLLHFLLSMKQMAQNSLENPDFPPSENPGTPIL